MPLTKDFSSNYISKKSSSSKRKYFNNNDYTVKNGKQTKTEKVCIYSSYFSHLEFKNGKKIM